MPNHPGGTYPEYQIMREQSMICCELLNKILCTDAIVASCKIVQSTHMRGTALVVHPHLAIGRMYALV